MSKDTEHSDSNNFRRYEPTILPGNDTIAPEDNYADISWNTIKPLLTRAIKYPLQVIYPKPFIRDKYQSLVIYPKSGLRTSFPLALVERIKKNGINLTVYWKPIGERLQKPTEFPRSHYGYSPYEY